ncbi:MAG: hypothetical protein ABJN36_13805 [Cyclobacteriaceae bacterium]
MDIIGRSALYSLEWVARQAPLLPKALGSQSSTEQDAYASFVKETAIINRSYGFFAASEFVSIDNQPTFRSIEEEVTPDLTFQIEDYVLFPTMGELIKEVARPLYYGHKKDGNVVRVRSLDRPATADPTYVIDGIVIRNTNFFLSLAPVDVEQIKIIRASHKLFRFGLMGKNGIVIVNTKSGNAREPVRPENLVDGLSKSHVFPNSDYSGSQPDPTPNFRTCLYWNPYVTTDQEGKSEIDFYLSDDAGEMIIQVEGFNNLGEWFFAQKSINVD